MGGFSFLKILKFWECLIGTGCKLVSTHSRLKYFKRNYFFTVTGYVTIFFIVKCVTGPYVSSVLFVLRVV